MLPQSNNLARFEQESDYRLRRDRGCGPLGGLTSPASPEAWTIPACTPGSCGIGDRAACRAGAGGDPLFLRAPRLTSATPSPSVKRVPGGTAAVVYFDHDSFLLNLESLELLWSLGDELRFIAHAPTVVVDGHTSSEGPSQYNEELSEKRRLAVVAALSSRLDAPIDFSGKPYGESIPALAEVGSAGDLEQQRALNRRVEVFILVARNPDAAEPLDLDLSLPPLGPETLQERLNRILTEPPPPARPKLSLTGELTERFDKFMDGLFDKSGVKSVFIRDLVKDGARALVEKGLGVALDRALDQTPLDTEGRKAFKNALKAGAKTEFRP